LFETTAVFDRTQHVYTISVFLKARPLRKGGIGFLRVEMPPPLQKNTLTVYIALTYKIPFNQGLWNKRDRDL
jgi:hypothetical protein